MASVVTRQIIYEVRAKLRGTNFEKISQSVRDLRVNLRKLSLDFSTGFKDNKSMQRLGKDIVALGGDMGRLTQSFTKFLKLNFGSILQNLATGFANILKATGPLAAGIAGVTLAFFGLNRAIKTADVVPVERAFRNLTQGLSESGDFLKDLQVAADGTINQFELMKNTNLALAGATEQVRKEFGGALPQLLQIARVQAQATGQSVDYLFNSLVTGVKRSSPRLIDNTGLIVKVGDANEAYAEKVGKSVDQLTEQEKQIALLNNVLESGNRAIEAAGGVAETASLKMQRLSTTFQDLGIEFGLAFQPLLDIVLDVADGFTMLIVDIVNPFNRVITQLSTVLKDVWDEIVFGLQPLLFFLKEVNRAIFAVLEAFVSLLVIALEPIILGIKLAALAIRGILEVLSPLGMVITFIADVAEHLASRLRDVSQVFRIMFSVLKVAVQDAASYMGVSFENIAKFFKESTNLIKLGVDILILGFARVLGNLAGIITSIVPHVKNAVAKVAKVIADFLIGESPPPKGPLSNIDKGGENTMLAWLDGFTNASMQPIEEVAQFVADSLGNIATYSLVQVEQAFAALDAQVQPFIDKVSILQSSLEELQAPVENALDALDRQQQKLLQQFNQGNLAVIESIRAIDAQKQALNGALQARQDEVTQAQVQLALVKATQAEERALLEIRKRQLGPVQAVTQEREKAAKAKKEKATKGESKVAGEPLPSGAGSQDIDFGFGKDLNEDLEGLSEFGVQILEQFNAGMAEGTADAAAANRNLAEQTGRLREGFSGENLTSRFLDPLTQPFKDAGTYLNETFLPQIFDIPNKITTFFQTNSIAVAVLDFIRYPFVAAKNALDKKIEEIKFTVSTFFSFIQNGPQLGGFGAAIGGLFGGNALGWLTSPFRDSFTAINTLFTNFKNFIFGDEGIFPTLRSNFETFQKDLIDLFDPILDIFRPSGENSFSNKVQQMYNNVLPIVTNVKNTFENLKTDMLTLWETIGGFFETYLISPLILALDTVITAINGFFKFATDKLNKFIKDFNDAMSRVASFFGLTFQELPTLDFEPIQLVSEALTANVPNREATNPTTGIGMQNANITNNNEVRAYYRIPESATWGQSEMDVAIQESYTGQQQSNRYAALGQ